VPFIAQHQVVLAAVAPKTSAAASLSCGLPVERMHRLDIFLAWPAPNQGSLKIIFAAKRNAFFACCVEVGRNSALCFAGLLLKYLFLLFFQALLYFAINSSAPVY